MPSVATFNEASLVPFLFRCFSLPLPDDPKVDLLLRELLDDDDAVQCFIDGAGLFADERDHLLYDILDRVDNDEQRSRLTTQVRELQDDGEIGSAVARLIVADLAPSDGPEDPPEASFFLEACLVATVLADPTGRPRLPWLADELDAYELARRRTDSGDR